MNISAISAHDSSRNLFIRYANSFMSAPRKESNDDDEAKNNELKKLNKTMGIETLTIFPKEVVNGKTTIIA